MVLITGDQHRGTVEEAVLKGLRHPGHVDIIDIDQVEYMRPPATGFARHDVPQTGIRDRTRIFLRTLLVVISDIDLHVGGELQPGLCPRLDSATAVRTPFVRTPSADSEYFGTAEEVLIRIIKSCRYAPVAGAIGPFDLRSKRVTSATRDGDIAVQQAVSGRHKSDIDVLDRRQGVHAGIGALLPQNGIGIPATDTTCRTDSTLAQETASRPTVVVTKTVRLVLQLHRVRQTSRVVVHLIMHVADLVAGPEARQGLRIQLHDVGREMQFDIHLVRVQRTVGRELQHRFLEIEIAPVTQHVGDTYALLIQHLGRELIP